MALNIKNSETEKLARDLARLRGEGITDALTAVLRREVERERRKRRPDDKEKFHRDIEEIVQEVKRLPVLDDRAADEILGYNEQGHFD
jgi:antitoxin VapB